MMLEVSFYTRLTVRRNLLGLEQLAYLCPAHKVPTLNLLWVQLHLSIICAGEQSAPKPCNLVCMVKVKTMLQLCILNTHLFFQFPLSIQLIALLSPCRQGQQA